MKEKYTGDSVKEAKQFLRENYVKGVDCPCCGQLVKLYKRKITSASCKALINLYKLCKQNGGYHHLKEFMVGVADTGSNDFNKLKFYNFIHKRELTEKEKVEGKKKSSGFYTITREGSEFVEGIKTVQKYCLVYDDRFLGFTGENINIEIALGNNFNYRELMGEYLPKPSKQEELVYG